LLKLKRPSKYPRKCKHAKIMLGGSVGLTGNKIINHSIRDIPDSQIFIWIRKETSQHLTVVGQTIWDVSELRKRAGRTTSDIKLSGHGHAEICATNRNWMYYN